MGIWSIFKMSFWILSLEFHPHYGDEVLCVILGHCKVLLHSMCGRMLCEPDQTRELVYCYGLGSHGLFLEGRKKTSGPHPIILLVSWIPRSRIEEPNSFICGHIADRALGRQG